MKLFRKHRLSNGEIIFLGILSILAVLLSRLSLKVEKDELYELKLEASRKTLEAYRFLKRERLRRGIEIDPVNDPMESGLLGWKESPITTSWGDYEAKLTSINPNWSAVVVDMLNELGIRKGDTVAMHITGSFPAINVAVIIGIETYGAVPVFASSIGSSSWGANIPEFTWADMEKALYDSGYIRSRSVLASIGGNSGVGAGLSEEGRRMIREAIRRNGLELLEVLPLQKAIDIEYEALTSKGNPKVFVNVGGSVISIGNPHKKYLLHPGINEPRMYEIIKDENVEGLVAKFLKQGKPVINFLEIITMAKRYGMPIAPASIPEVGTANVFSKPKYPVWFHIVLLAILGALVFLTLNGYLGSLFKNPYKEEEVL